MSDQPACSHPPAALEVVEAHPSDGTSHYWISCNQCNRLIAADLSGDEFRRLAAYKLTGVPGIEGIDFPAEAVAMHRGAPRRRYPCRTCGGERLSIRATCPHCGTAPRRGQRSRPREGTPDTVAAVAADLRDAAMRIKVYVSPGADTPDECEYLIWRLRQLAGRLDRLAGSPVGRRAIVPRRGPMPAAPLRDQSGDMP